ncbi:DUF7452 domain-containing protein [Marinicella meishanensis]|uniref:DUF7452 domain-containing protein n=1 Tax=Marinicella meishanensis TaxID=2873263 RepID=UPI001CBDBA12|nr:hypothetical protein [Marinicella sp. NBU2979]
MKIITTITLLIIAQLGLAVDWPGITAPCNSSLQACVNGSAEHTTIFINTNGVINETIETNKAISLVAGNGYKPVFSEGHHVEIVNTATTHRTVRIEGLTFLRGGIAYTHASGSLADGSLVIKNNHITASNSSIGNIKIVNQSWYNELSINVDFNHLHDDRIYHESNNTVDLEAFSKITGRLYGNTIRNTGFTPKAINLFSWDTGGLDLDIIGNELYNGHNSTSLFARSSGGLIHLDIGHNAFYANDSSELYDAIFIVTHGTSRAKSKIVNNTILGANMALQFNPGPGPQDVYLYNNIVAYSFMAVRVMNNHAAMYMANDHNLYHMVSNPDSHFTRGPNHLNIDPQVKGLQNGRLGPESPAIDSGHILSLLALGAVPMIDADGTNRIKYGISSSGLPQLDMGAYEFGDEFFIHQSNTTSHVSRIEDDAINGENTANDIHLTANWNPPGVPGVYNNDNEGLYYAGGFWRIFNQGIRRLAPNASFNVYQYNSDSSFGHTALAGDSYSILDHRTLDQQADRIVQITQSWRGVYNPHPVGVMPFFGHWLVVNMDLADIPVGSHFNIYSQEPSKSAWTHIASEANSTSHITFLDHPLINDVNCAQLQVTQSAEEGVFNAAPIGVYHTGIGWAIFNQDFSTMQPGSAFHVMVNPAQIDACTE